MDEFKKLDTGNGADGKITFKVTTDFYYGQKDGKGKNRFLVFHESDRTIYQVSHLRSAFDKQLDTGR